LEISEKKNHKLYLCSIYEDRPETCKKYPWNHANQLFVECIFVDVEKERLRTMEEMLALKTQEEISDYCIQCGRCCFFGPAACSKLKIINASSDKEAHKNDVP
jgi:Fe-S-cluster containining protein